MKSEQRTRRILNFGLGHRRRFRQDPRPYLGWIATLLTTSIAGFWAYWSGLEAFHEGWWAPALVSRILGVFVFIVYDGRVSATPRNAFMGSIGFRAVREP